MRHAALALALILVSSCHRAAPVPSATTAETAGTADAAPADAAAPAATTGGVHLLSEGAEPRSVVTFAFVPGRREGRVLTIDSRFEQGDQTKMHDRIDLRLEVRYPSKEVAELVVKRAETTATDVPGVPGTVGTTVTLTLGKGGAAAPAAFHFPAGVDGTAKNYVQGALQQAAPLLVPTVPPIPLGEGARWRADAAEGPVHSLVSRRAGTLVLEERAEIHGPHRVGRHVVQVNEDHVTRIEAPLDGVARHAESTVVENRDKGNKHTTRLDIDPVDAP